MTYSQRKTKKTIIATVYALLHLLVIGSLVFTFWPRVPEPEIVEEIRPENLRAEEIVLLPQSNGNADIVAIISNPNDQFGAQNIRYQFVLENSAGDTQVIPGTTFILPGERTKYVVSLNYPLEEYQVVDFKILPNYDWKRISRFDLPELLVRSVDLGISQKAGNFFTLTAVLTNQSEYSLKEIELVAIIENSAGEIVAANRTFLRDVLNGQAREFEMIWPEPIPDSQIADVTVYSYSNILTNEQFLLRNPEGVINQE